MDLRDLPYFMGEWTRWKPREEIAGRYYIDSFGMSENWSLIVQLSNTGNTQKIKIVFPNIVGSYRYTNESYYIMVFGDLSDVYPDDFYSHWSLFKITNSQYLQWLLEQSYTLADRRPLQHYCIFAGDEVIDVATQFEPEVTIIS